MTDDPEKHYTIRILTTEDLLQFRELRLRGLRESPEAFGADHKEWLKLPIEEVAQRMKGTDDSFVLGAFVGTNGKHDLVGIAGLRREKNIKTKHTAGIWGVYVDVPHRGTGIARALMVEILGRAKKMDGLEKLVLSVTAQNQAAQELYEKLDFKPYGHDLRALKIEGTYFDEILMVLFLKG